MNILSLLSWSENDFRIMKHLAQCIIYRRILHKSRVGHLLEPSTNYFRCMLHSVSTIHCKKTLLSQLYSLKMVKPSWSDENFQFCCTIIFSSQDRYVFFFFFFFFFQRQFTWHKKDSPRDTFGTRVGGCRPLHYRLHLPGSREYVTGWYLILLN